MILWSNTVAPVSGKRERMDWHDAPSRRWQGEKVRPDNFLKKVAGSGQVYGRQGSGKNGEKQ